MQHDPRTEEILTKMQKILAQSRVLKKKHDALTEEYLKLEREFEARIAQGRTVT